MMNADVASLRVKRAMILREEQSGEQKNDIGGKQGKKCSENNKNKKQNVIV